MSIPTSDPFPRLRSQDELLRWAEQLVSLLEKTLRDLRFTQGTLTLTNGLNNNVQTDGAILVRVVGPSGAFTITGISGGSPGRLLVIINTTGQNMTIANENAGSQANNRITTSTGADVVSAGNAFATLVYQNVAGVGRWNLTGFES